MFYNFLKIYQYYLSLFCHFDQAISEVIRTELISTHFKYHKEITVNFQSLLISLFCIHLEGNLKEEHSLTYSLEN